MFEGLLNPKARTPDLQIQDRDFRSSIQILSAISMDCCGHTELGGLYSPCAHHIALAATYRYPCRMPLATVQELFFFYLFYFIYLFSFRLPRT
jgi:hypothetical protein